MVQLPLWVERPSIVVNTPLVHFSRIGIVTGQELYRLGGRIVRGWHPWRDGVGIDHIGSGNSVGQGCEGVG
jgi:hypothetical protein